MLRATRSSLPRREFIKQCSAAAGAMFVVPTIAGAIEPLERRSGGRFKFSLAAYSYRNLFKDGTCTLADFIDDCAAMKLDGTELTSYYFPTPTTNEFLLQCKEQCEQAGLEISGTAVGNDFGHTDPQKRQQQIEHVKTWVDHAATMGAPVIRIFAGHQKLGVAAEETHRLIVSAIEECCEYAGSKGIRLALENHGGPTATADGVLAIVRDVKSDAFGVNLDTGNFHSDDIYGELERCAPYAINVQVKVVVSGPDRKKRPTDFARLAQILRGVGYNGYVVLEYEESGDPREECPKFVEQLRQAFA